VEDGGRLERIRRKKKGTRKVWYYTKQALEKIQDRLDGYSKKTRKKKDPDLGVLRAGRRAKKKGTGKDSARQNEAAHF